MDNAIKKVNFEQTQKDILGNGVFEASDIWNVARNVGGSAVGSVLSAVESMTDPVLAAYYGITGQHNRAKQTYANSWSQQATDFMRGDATNSKTMDYINNIVGNVGEMGTRLAIAAGLAAITGGASAAINGVSAGSALLHSAQFANASMGLLAGSSFGNAMQNAVNTTGELGVKEHIYGIGSALVELGTEKMFDAMGVMGGGALDKTVSKITNGLDEKVLGRIALSFGEEFIEEAASELANVPLSRATIDENATTSVKDVVNAGIQGGIVGAIFGAGSSVATQKTRTNIGNRIIQNGHIDSTIEEGKTLGLDYATYLANRQTAGAEVSPTQLGKLACEIENKKFDDGVEAVQKKYGVSKDKAITKYADEVALNDQYRKGGAITLTPTTAVNQETTASAIDTALNNGADIVDIYNAGRLATRTAKAVDYIYDANNQNGITEDSSKITINLASKKLKTQIASHEALHTMNAKVKTRIADEVKKTEWYNKNSKEIYDKYYDFYLKEGNSEAEAKAMADEEVSARFMETAINDVNYAIKQADGNNTLIDDVVAYFKRISKHGDNLTESDRRVINRAYNAFIDGVSLNKAKAEIREENKVKLSENAEKVLEKNAKGKGKKLDLSEETDNDQANIVTEKNGIDNQKKVAYNKLEGESYERTDEFKRIQAESLRLSDERLRFFHSRIGTVDEALRGRLSRVFNRQLETERGGLRYDSRVLKNEKTNSDLKLYLGVSASDFHDIFEIVQKYLPKGDAVTVHPTEDYENNKNYLSSDGLGGFSITENGDVISVFNLGTKGFLKTIRELVRTEGGKTLDCFNSSIQPLAEMYEKTLGFKTASVLDFNYEILSNEYGKEHADYFVKTYGKAPVHFMVNTDVDIQLKHFNKDQYDEAVSYRDGFSNTKNQYDLSERTKDYGFLNKSYTKKEASKLVDESLAINSFGDDIITLSDKGRIVDAVYKRMNNVDYNERGNMASRYADYLVNNAFSTNIDTLESLQDQREILSYFRDNIRHKIDLTSIADEIKQKYGTSARGIMLAWSRKGATGIVKFAHDNESVLSSLGINIESDNSADIFFELYDAYSTAKNDIAKATNVEIKKAYSAEEIAKIKAEIKEQVLNAYANSGKIDSGLAKLITANTKLREINKMLTRKADGLQTANEMLVELTKLTEEATKYAKRGYSASVLKNEEWSGVMASAGKIVYRNKLNVANISVFFEKLKRLYTEERLTVGNESYYDKGVGEKIQYICDTLRSEENGVVNLDKDQLKAIKITLKGLKHLYKTFDTVVIDNKRVETKELADNGVSEIERLPEKSKNAFLNETTKYACDTRSYFRYLSGYNDDGTLMKLFDNLTKAESNTNVMKMNLNKPFEEFYAKNKTYAKRLKTATIEMPLTNKTTRLVERVELPLDEAMLLYLTARDEHAKLGLYEGGFNYIEKNTLKEYVPLEKDILALKDKFTQEDKDYMNLSHILFNKEAKKLKVDTDMKVLGYTNISDGSTNYIPLRRDVYSIVKSFDSMDSYIEDFNSCYNTSINKERVKGTKSAIALNGLSAVISRHIQQVTMYAGMYEAVTAIRRVLNYNTTKNSSDIVSMSKSLNKRSFGFTQYFDKFMLDIQGNRKAKDTPAKIVEYIRSAYAKSTLGANIKVMASQFSSYPMAAIYISPRNLSKGMGNKVTKETVYEHCKFLQVRNNSNTIIKAEGMVDKVGKVGEVLMKPISTVDDFTVRKIFEAACYECADKNKSKLFSDENYKQASELTEMVVRETQPMFSDIERSSLQRNDSELVKLFTMFSSATQKQLSRLMDGIGQYAYAKQMGASGEVLNEAKAKMSRSLMSITTATFLYTAMGLMIKYALGREDEEKTLMQNFATDFGGSVSGMIPFMRDIYGYFVNGYESENFLDNTINNTLGGIKQTYKMFDSIVAGEDLTNEQIIAPLKRVLFAGGQLSGVPTRNIYNQIDGIIKKYFIPEKITTAKSLTDFTSPFENQFNNMF